MDVPVSCKQWKDLMAASADPVKKKVLENIEKDPCVPDQVASAFFASLAAEGAPQDEFDAHCKLQKVVRDQFICTGKEVPEYLFRQLLRLEHVGNLRYRVPREVLRPLGLTDANLANAPEEELRSITDEYNGPVLLGNGLQVVWATDRQMTRPLEADLQTLSARLGRETATGEAWTVICAYNRNDIGGTLHVPRALDAVDQGAFEVAIDCESAHGTTKPNPSAAGSSTGLPEAVHRGCTLRPFAWSLRRIA